MGGQESALNSWTFPVYDTQTQIWPTTGIQGRVLGGTSSINAQIFWRPSIREYESQKSFLNSPTVNLTSVMRSLETTRVWNGSFWSKSSANGLGTNGPINSVVWPEAPASNLWKRSIAKSMLRHGVTVESVDDLMENRPARDVSQTGAVSTYGIVFWNKTTRKYERLRESTSTAFLKRRETPKHLTIKTGCTVDRILFNAGGVARGVRYIQNGYSFEAHLNHVATQLPTRAWPVKPKVILSAGIHDAQILHRSGVGATRDLMSAGIPQIINNPEVGRHLVDHAYVVLTLLRGLPDSMRGMEQIFDVSEGLVSMGRYQDYASPSNKIKWQIKVSINRLGELNALVVYNAASQKSEGYVKALSSDPLQHLFVYLPLLKDESDYSSMARLVGITLEAAEHFYHFARTSSLRGAKDIEIPSNIRTAFKLISALNDTARVSLLSELIQKGILPRAQAMNHYSCSMSRAVKRSTSGAPDDLHVRGTTNVMVADAQVLQPIIAGNPSLSAIIMGVLAYMIATNHFEPVFSDVKEQ